MDRKPKGYWTFERCRCEALKYNTVVDFAKNSQYAYQVSRRKKWLHMLSQHMSKPKPSNFKWTFKTCNNEAKKYKYRKDFKQNASGAYTIAQRNGWLDEICSHMKILGNLYNRVVYAYEFDDNFVYVGVTYNISKRNQGHLNDVRSSVYKHINKTKSTYSLKVLTEFIPVDDAKVKEGSILHEYKSNGWNILNKVKTGGTGGNNIVKWSYDRCKCEALKYNSRTTFKKGSIGAYNATLRNNWVDELCTHMKLKHKPNGYWNKERCLTEAQKYNTRYEFQKCNQSAYHKALKLGWLDSICSHMISVIKPHKHWDYNTCKGEASKYKNRTTFAKLSGGAYNTARKNNWLDDFYHKNK